MAHLQIGPISFTYEASSRTLPRRKCHACGRRGGMSETVSSTNGGPQQQTVACRFCGAAAAKALPQGR
jgi:hypothetical protein